MSAIPAAGEPVDRGFSWAEISWTPMSQYQWGNHDIAGWMVDDVVMFLRWEREGERTPFSHESGGASDAVLLGIQAMPAVDFEIKWTSADVVLELGIRFELTVKGGDSRISFSGDPVELAFKPWEPVAY